MNQPLQSNKLYFRFSNAVALHRVDTTARYRCQRFFWGRSIIVKGRSLIVKGRSLIVKGRSLIVKGRSLNQ